MTAGSQPTLRFDIAYPERLSRGLIFVKWLLAIPHAIVLNILGYVLYFTTALAFFLILILGRYPRGLWNFGVMVTRWQARYSAYVMLMRDEYPPFGDDDYPVLFHLEYPERLSRWKIFVKWLLLIPHFFVLSTLMFAVLVVWFVAWWAILFTGRYPRGMFDFTTGVMRWFWRVTVYLLLLTDAYPPFSMDPDDPAPAAYLPAYGTAAPSNG